MVGRKTFSFFGVAFTKDEMPEDDPIWYERVLFDDAMLRGHFSFRGAASPSQPHPATMDLKFVEKLQTDGLLIS